MNLIGAVAAFIGLSFLVCGLHLLISLLWSIPLDLIFSTSLKIFLVVVYLFFSAYVVSFLYGLLKDW